ncbi:hypothetical protein Tco_0332512 [Tanacetum coccineum]
MTKRLEIRITMTCDHGVDLVLESSSASSSINNNARLSNKFGGFYFSFKFGITGLLHHVITTIAERIRGSKLEYKFQDQENSEDIFSFGSALEDFICVVFVPDRNIEIHNRRLSISWKQIISWQCKKQTIVANSTTEAEYVVAASCCGQVLWIQNQMLDYGYNFMNTKIFIDNESTICIVKNLVFHSKTKHIKIRPHFIRDSNEKKLI